MSTTTCTCCRGRSCVRVRPVDEISFDAALRRLNDTLVGQRQAGVLEQRRLDRTPHVLARPWEMTLPEFEAAAEPSVESRWGVPRFRGLSRSLLRRELHFLLRCPGGPEDGYRVRVPAERDDLYTEPHRAFVEAALAEGLSVAPRVLSDYPDLPDGRALAAPPRLDFTAAES
jgi:hypothetical protein